MTVRLRIIPWAFAVSVVCVAVPAGRLIAHPPRHDTGPIVFTQLPVETGTRSAPGARSDTGRLPPGSRIVLFDPAAPDAEPIDLTPGFAAAGRPDVSYDGRRMLFVAREAPADPLNVWELALDGGPPRRITDRPTDCTRAIYASTLYTLDAAAPVDQIAFCVAAAEEGGSTVGCAALYTSRTDGSRLRQITFNPYGANDPWLLSDGRLLYASARPPDAGGGTALFTVHTDGTDVFVFADAHGPPAIRGMPCETDDGWIVYVESVAGARLDGGALVAVARTRSLHTRRVVAAATAGTYHSPSALADGRLLVSYRETRGGTYGVHVMDSRLGTFLRRVFDSPDFDDVDAVTVRPRHPPAGRSSVVDERVDFGFLYGLDAYLTDRVPTGTFDEGSIKTLRVFRGPGGRPGGASTAMETETMLGEVPVHADGSFYLQVPARTPLRLETLDADGKSLQAMQNWIWVMPSERRGCIGCHADRESTPPNRHVLALRESPRKIGIENTEQARPSAGDPASRSDRK